MNEILVLHSGVSQSMSTTLEVGGMLMVLMMGYLTIASVVFGCPYCLMPDTAWPVTVYRHLREQIQSDTRGQMVNSWPPLLGLALITLAVAAIVVNQMIAEARQAQTENWDVICNGISGCRGVFWVDGLVVALSAVVIVILAAVIRELTYSGPPPRGDEKDS